MEKSFDVYYQNKKVGTVIIHREGLYYAFSCRCELPDSSAYRLIIGCGGKRVNLGICTPKGNAFGLDTKQPVKRIGEGKMDFFLVCIDNPIDGNFIPVFEDKPIDCLSRLSDGRMSRQNGQAGIILPC